MSEKDECSSIINADSNSSINDSSYEEFRNTMDTQIAEYKGRKFVDNEGENACRAAESLLSLKEMKVSENSRSTDYNNIMKEEALLKLTADNTEELKLKIHETRNALY